MSRYLELRPEIKYMITDVQKFFSSDKYDIIIDKGLVDCLLSNPSDPLGQLKRVMSNIAEVMHDRSCWISISFDIEREMHF